MTIVQCLWVVWGMGLAYTLGRGFTLDSGLLLSKQESYRGFWGALGRSGTYVAGTFALTVMCVFYGSVLAGCNQQNGGYTSADAAMDILMLPWMLIGFIVCVFLLRVLWFGAYATHASLFAPRDGLSEVWKGQ
jgi:hypothetical protein